MLTPGFGDVGMGGCGMGGVSRRSIQMTKQ